MPRRFSKHPSQVNNLLAKRPVEQGLTEAPATAHFRRELRRVPETPESIEPSSLRYSAPPTQGWSARTGFVAGVLSTVTVFAVLYLLDCRRILLLDGDRIPLSASALDRAWAAVCPEA